MTYSKLITSVNPNPMNYGSRNGIPIDRIIIHHNATTNKNVAMNTWLQGGPAGTSAHYELTPTEIIGCIEEEYAAFHAGGTGPADPPRIANPNQRSIGLEHVNSTGAPNWNVAPETIQNSARLIADICKRWGIPIDRTHILGHNEVTSTACPGGINVDQLVALAQQVAAKGDAALSKTDGHLDTANINTGAFHIIGWLKDSEQDLSKTTPWLFFMSNGHELARVKGKWVNRADVGNAGVDFGGSTPQALQDHNFTVMFRASDNKGDEIQAELKFSNEFNLPKVSAGYLDKTKPNKDRELTLTGWHLDTRQIAGDAHWLYLMDADTNKPLKKWDVSKDSFQPSEDVAKHYSSQIAQATTCRFSTTINVPDGLDGVKSYIISRYTSDKDGNGDGTKDYKFTDSLIFL